MENKYRKFYVDWWNIRRSTVYGLIVFVVVTTVVVIGGWWAIRYNWFTVAQVSDIPKDAARIVSFEGDVRITRAATRETIVVTKETYVAAGDTVQTQADSRAVVQMIDGSSYSVRPNSTVVIRDNSSLFGGTNVRVSLDGGQLNVRTNQQPEKTENVVEMLDSETRLRSQTDASFNADAAAGGGEIRISRGSVETTIGNEKTTIAADEYAALSNGRITSRERLLGQPQPMSPANMSQIVDSRGSGVGVTFAWNDDGGSSYYIQVSKSPTFAADAILADRGGLTGREFRLAGLSPGNYYWRLKSTARSGQTSEWNDAWKFSVVRPDSAGVIEAASWSAERVGGNVYIISGRTRPGNVARSQGREVNAGSDGTFRLQIATPLSEIAIELADERGNRAGFVISLANSRVLRRF